MPPRERSLYAIGMCRSILDPEHVHRWGEAVWLFLWYVDHQTDDKGAVLGGQVLTYDRIDLDLGVGRRKLRRWQKALEEDLELTPSRYGFTARIRRQKKFLRGHTKGK